VLQSFLRKWKLIINKEGEDKNFYEAFYKGNVPLQTFEMPMASH